MQTPAGEKIIDTIEKMKIVIEGESNAHITAADIVINCFLIHVSAIVGAVGNAITLIILSRSVTKDTTSIILLSMAACDIFFLVNLSVSKCDCIVARFDSALADVYRVYVMSYVRSPGRWAEFTALSHTAVISFERFISVFFPLQASCWITRRRIVTVLVLIYSVWIIYFIPYAAFIFEIEWSYKNIYNRTLPSLRETKWFRENRLMLDTLSDIVGPTVGFLSAAVIAAQSSAIAHRLNHVSKQRINMVSKKMDGSRIDVKASRMLLVVCVLFNLCNFPGNLIYVYFYVDPSLKPPNKLHGLLTDVEELLLAVNAASNFFVYTLMSAKFYRSVIGLFGCRRLL